jgi:hypothetical protein
MTTIANNTRVRHKIARKAGWVVGQGTDGWVRVVYGRNTWSDRPVLVRAADLEVIAAK